MTPEELAPLIEVAEAQKQQAEAKLAETCRRETQMRALLADMADQFQHGLTQPADTLAPMHGLGAHQAWVDFARRKRAEINGALAMVMAEKLDRQAVLRRDLGRCEALKELRADALKARKKKQEAREQEKMLAAYILRDSPA